MCAACASGGRVAEGVARDRLQQEGLNYPAARSHYRPEHLRTSALVSAVAAVGYRELAERLTAAHRRRRPQSSWQRWRSPTCSSRSSGPRCSGSCSESHATGTTMSALPRPPRCRCMFARSSSEASRTLTLTRWPPRSRRSSTGPRSCTWTASSTPLPRRGGREGQYRDPLAADGNEYRQAFGGFRPLISRRP